MNEAKHTPPPWEWRDGGHGWELVHFLPGETFRNGEPAYSVVHTDGSAGGEYSPDIDPRGPDARLIAAAPELLAALEEIARLTRNVAVRPEARNWVAAVRANAESAIAKTRGTP